MSIFRKLKRRKELESQTQIRKGGKIVGFVRPCNICKTMTSQRKLARGKYECIPCSKARLAGKVALEAAKPSSDNPSKGESA